MRLYMTKEQLHTRGGILDELLEKLFDAAMLVDQDGNILHNTSGSLALRDLKEEDVTGRPHKNFEPNSLFPAVLESGQARLAAALVIAGRKCIASIYPIFDGETVIGALGTVLFRNISSLKHVIAGLQENDTGPSGDLYNMLARVGTSYTFQDYIGEAPATKTLLEQCRRAAISMRTVLLIGETGTGKEVLANAIHSGRGDTSWKPFIKINCSAIPAPLLESELFGHEKGAFTGATAAKKGKFELAAQGSILLDEIGDMDLIMQSKLLRVLEEHEFERVGGTKMLPMNARVIASTNVNLRERAAEGKFRADLYYRLSALEIHIPPLRERREDIPLLIRHFIHQDQLGIEIASEAMELLMRYRWPGNIRELRNVVNRLDIMCSHKVITADDVRPVLSEAEQISGAPEIQPAPAEPDNEKQALLDALQRNRYNLTQAAKELGICRATLYNRLNRYGLSKKHLG